MSNIQYSIISLISQHLFRPSDLNHFITENLFPFVSPSLFLPTPQFGSVQFSHSVMSDSVTPWTAAHQASLSITNSRSLLKLMSIESVMPSNHLILCRPSCPQFFPVSESFQMSQSIGVSASLSVLPINFQDWFPLGWTGWISLQSKGLSRVFSNTTIQKHQFFCTQLYL